MRTNEFVFLTLGALVLAACGDSGAGGSGSGGSPADSTTETITPAEGGEIEGGEATLTFPANSVGSDTEVTLTVRAKTAETATDIFEFTPNGLALEVPATLVIDIFDVSLPEGKSYALAIEDGGSFSVVNGTTFGSGTINADITELATFTVIFADAATGPCEPSCMAQPDAVCCTQCGSCVGAAMCQPVCDAPFQWDCEVGCCFDYEAVMCVE